MADSDKKPVLNLVPAILTGTAALLAALTTVYVNVRNDLKSEAASPAALTVPASKTEPPLKAPALPQPLRLQLQRIAVQEDGAVGDADWRFAVEADGQPLFALQQDSMSAQGGRNIVVIAADRDAQAPIELAPGQRLPIVVKGWRSGWFKSGSEPAVVGEGVLSAAGALAPITVTADDGKKGSFTFYFSAAPQPD